MPPRILQRPQHTVSRKAIDADALKVLYRLKNNGYVAYLVGGGVRDLLLGRKPKDFDIGTSAHPQQVRKLFRNCFVIGRRFRLCHIRFGRKVVEVSTFRRQAEPEQGDTLIRRDNTFGTPEEDAFRRDFTVNALFYDIATFSVIDYVEGLEDLENRVIRTIGDPAVRFREDPVRMLRAVALAARLGFTIDRDTAEAIRFLRGEIVKSSPARILDELYKVLRQGAARKTFQMLHDLGLLAYLLPEAEKTISEEGERLLGSLSRLDDYRNAGLATPEDLTNPLLMGTLLVPLGVPAAARRLRPARGGRRRRRDPGDEPEGEPDDVAAEMAALGETEADGPASPSVAALDPAVRAARPRPAPPHPGRPEPAARGPPLAAREADARGPRLPGGRAAVDGDPRRDSGAGAGRALAQPGRGRHPAARKPGDPSAAGAPVPAAQLGRRAPPPPAPPPAPPARGLLHAHARHPRLTASRCHG